jgi:hypothetical protein
MKHLLHTLKISMGRLNTHQIRLLTMLLLIALFVLGAGAPEGGGGGGW